jgi:hypothetical protein
MPGSILSEIVGIDQHPPDLAARPHLLDAEGVIF